MALLSATAVAFVAFLTALSAAPASADLSGQFYFTAMMAPRESITGDTLCDIDKPIVLERMEFPEPVISVAVEPKSKPDQEKMGIALGKLAQAMIEGAVVLQIKGTFDDGLRLVKQVVDSVPVTIVNSINPYRRQGQKTAAFEIE